MIDVHTHILPSIDDGARNINQTIDMIDEAYEAGFTDIITTSHYIEETYDIDKGDREVLIDNIKPLIKQKIKIHNGAEAYISPDIVELYKNGTIPTLAQSRYVLFELPMNSEVIYTRSIVKEFTDCGYIPILAHPERYSNVKKNVDNAFEYIKMGALLQCNYGSFIGKYGAEAQEAVIKLLKRNQISFLGTDTHRPNSIYVQVKKAIEVIKKHSSCEVVDKLTTTNPQKILENVKIENYI